LGRLRIDQLAIVESQYYEAHCSDIEGEGQYIMRLRFDASVQQWDFDNSLLEHNRILEARKLLLEGKSARSFYALKDGRYFVPLSDPFSFAGTLHVDELLRIAPANDLLYFGLWESLALQMMSDAHYVTKGKLARAVWQDRWGALAGGPILVKAITGYLENGDLSRTERLRAIEVVQSGGDGGPELAENLILRLCGAWERKRINPESFLVTLVCPHFRRSITLREIEQLRQAKSAYLESNRLPIGQDDLKVLSLAIAAIEGPTVSPECDNELTTIRPAQNIVSPLTVVEGL
jgi:hypothetical protein